MLSVTLSGVRTAVVLYVTGLAVLVIGLSTILLARWLAALLVIAGIAIFCAAIAAEERATESKEVDARAVSVHRADENDLLVAYEELSARLLELNPVRRVTTLAF